ncbi:thiamine phosphate synthase [Phreatobacter stygius]|uniref:Thiamine phosphate synthase n=1 Tax=Phreatobacter stygius TaxID=1940610 RepID=A0A4D7BAJ3_9HYPH|nr:thiamine phosphate synthase [Phreatobacter stygius]QCI67805.1 thiamine phosphate synthase [Phreatobacter stygius]
MTYPDRFYPVIDSLAWLRRLTALGVGTVQLRVKDLTLEQATALMREALTVTRGTPTRLVVNDWWQAAIDAGAEHVHLGQEDLADADVPAIRRAGLTLGVSTHDDDELDAALDYVPDYIALGPIYETTLKVMRFGPQGLERIRTWKDRMGAIPLIAIGGITLERAPAVYASGADSIAVVSDVTGNPDPDQRVRDWLSLAAKTA